MSAIAANTAREIFAILEQQCGARADNLCHGAEPFVRYLGEDLSRHEFRFCGNLGFGGKFYNNGCDWRVSCYPEDRTPERIAAISKANESLESLRNSILNETPDEPEPTSPAPQV